MAFVIRNLQAEEPGGGARYLGIIEGTGTYHNVEKELADRFATKEEADAALPWLGRMYGAANLVVEDENYDPAEAEKAFMALVVGAVQKAEKWMPESGLFTLEEMSALRVVMGKFIPGLKVLSSKPVPALSNLRPLLYTSRWEAAPPIPSGGAALNAGCMFVQADTETDPFQVVFFQQSGGYSAMFYPLENAWVQTQRAGMTSIAAGSGYCWNPNGPTGTVSSATANSITTNYTAVRNLGKYTIRLLSGQGAGQERVVSYNSVGANTVFVVTQPWTIQPDATTTWVLRSGRFFVFSGGTTLAGVSGSQRIYDIASLSDLGVSVSTVNLPASWGTSTAFASPNNRQFSTGTASAGGAATLDDTTKNWSLSWANFQVRILSGSGAGQIRTIVSSTTTQLTVSPAWSTPPSTDSVYVVEANEDFMYLIGNGDRTIYRYSWSANTWTVITPSVARVTVPLAATALLSIDQEDHPLWTDENACLNGRYLYSTSGIAAGSWERFDISTLAWSPAPGGNNTGDVLYVSDSPGIYAHGYIYYTVGGVGFRRFSPSKARVDGWGQWPSSLEFIVADNPFNHMFASKYTDPSGVEIRKVYCGVNTGHRIWCRQELDL